MNPIRENLADLADEVSIVDLYDRAVRSSRRLALTRAAIASAAVLVLIVAIGATGLALRSRPRALPPIGPIPSASASSAPTPSSTPTPDATGPSPNSSGNINGLGPMTAVAATTLPGRMFALGGNAVVELSDGQARSYPFPGDGGCPGNTVTVSPDGSRVAFVRGAYDAGGDIVVTELATLRTTVIPGPIWCAGRAIWFTPDSGSVVYYHVANTGSTQSRVDPAQRYRLTDGQVTALTDPGSGVFSVGSGGFSAGLLSGGVIIVKGADGAEVRRCTRPPSAEPEMVIGLSADGRYASLANRPQDISNQRNATRIVDTTTCQNRAVPASGEIVRSIQFTVDGGLVLGLQPSIGAAYHVRLLAPDLSTVADIPLPDTLAQFYRPLLYIG